jgi:hypothetical protein
MIEQNEYKSPAWDARLGDLADWHIVWGICTVCGHRAEIPRAVLWRGNTKHTRLREIADKLKCSPCEKKRRGLCRIHLTSKPR